MSGDEDSQGSAEQEVHDPVREEVRVVVEDDSEGGYATQRVKLVEAPGFALLAWVCLTMHGHAKYSLDD